MHYLIKHNTFKQQTLLVLFIFRKYPTQNYHTNPLCIHHIKSALSLEVMYGKFCQVQQD